MNNEMNEQMKIAVIGLGLIGGSMAKALKHQTHHYIYGEDKDETVVRKAILVDAINEPLTDEALAECDLIIVALYPQDTVDYVKEHSGVFKKGAVVLDCCGVKGVVCSQLFPVAKENGFVFMGGHPMAGLEHSGFAHSKNALFDNASMVLVPAKGTAIETVEKIMNLCRQIGFTNIQITTPEEHDKMIAFTSQLAHVVSSAYIQSPTAAKHEGFSAGSYKDLTRVAKLNEDMWTELFLDNREALVSEIDGIAERLSSFSKAIKEGDEDTLHEILKNGRIQKALIDGEVF